ncbi:hypothetical protein [Bradyrhizobium forestalis]|uniref:hypothetical protein n=1 Tax=Bradyrhizobium forestalis TaxID=1419263 RepID=UPI0011AFBBFA|nr:hypothetical protein [Bradyrhizobium forestalis]
MSSLRVVVALTVVAWCTCLTQAQAQYQYARDDIVVAMAGGLFNLIDHLGGSSYDGYYHNNGTVCTTPQLTGVLSHFGDRRESHYNLVSGTVNTTVALSVVAELRAAQCTFHTIDVSAGCLSGDIPLVGPPGSELFHLLVCALDVNNFFRVALPVPVRIPYPIAIPPQYVVNLPSIPATSNISIQLSFAQWDSSKWVPLPAPSDRQKVWPLSADLAFPDYLATTVANPADVVFHQGPYVVAKGTVSHARTFIKTNSLSKALSEGKGLTSFFSNYPYAIASITIRDSLIAPQKISSPSDERYGLIGGLFPMIVTATYQPSGSSSKIGISFVIAGVTVDISGNGGAPSIKASIIIDDLKAVDSATGKSLPARLAHDPSISIAPPIVKPNGSINLELANLDATLEVDTGTRHAMSFGSELKQAFNQAIPHPASIEPSISIGLPQCINMNNARFEALSPCRDYGGVKIGFVSKGSGPAPVNLSVDFSKTQVIGSPGQIEIDLERACVPTPHTSC